jgi:outer membrane biogenesis lipoprotein LolB
MYIETVKRILSALIACSLLAACGVVAKANARNDMQQSLAVYKACLAQHPQDVSQCEGARLAYDADMKAYRATSAGIQPGTNSTINYTNTTDQ